LLIAKPARQHAAVPSRVKVSQNDRERFADDPAAINRGAVRAQHQPSPFQLNQFGARQVNGDLLRVAFPATGLPSYLRRRAARRWSQQFGDSWQAYPA